MAELRYRTFRTAVYARLCPQDLAPADRDRFARLLDEMDEDGMIAFFQELPLNAQTARVIGILKEARELGDRLNAMDRTLPVLPHAEISACYDRLRVLGAEIGDLAAADALR